MNCELKTLYDHENFNCIESIIIVNQIKVFKFNSLTQATIGLYWYGLEHAIDKINQRHILNYMFLMDL